MNARTLKVVFSILVLGLTSFSSTGCMDASKIVGYVGGCDNKAQFVVWYNGNPISTAEVCSSELGGCYYTNDDGMTVEICSGTTQVFRGTVAYGQISRTFEVWTYKVGLNVFNLYL